MPSKSSLFNIKPEKISVYGTVWRPDCKRAKKFLGEHRVDYVNIDIEETPQGIPFVEKLNKGARIIPTISFSRMVRF